MNPLKVSCIYPDERQHCSHGRHSTPVGSHPILFRPNKRNNHLSSLLPCLAVSKIWTPVRSVSDLDYTESGMRETKEPR